MELLPMLLLIGVLIIPMWLMSRRQRRQQEQQMALQNALEVGDRVMTTSGLYGTVTDISDSATITVEIAAGVETEWLRQAVREKVGPDMDDNDDADDEASDVEDADEADDDELVNNEPEPVDDDDDTAETVSSDDSDSDESANGSRRRSRSKAKK